MPCAYSVMSRASAPAVRHQLCRPAVVELAPVGDVAQSVDVGVAIAMELHAEKVGGKPQAA